MISIYPDLESLSVAAAELFLERANQATKEHSQFSIALSGGNTPRRTYELLGEPPFQNQLPWEKIHIFWGDERCVPLDDPRSNAHMVNKILLEKVPIPSDQVHPITCVGNPARAAKDYEKLLRGFFQDQPPRFDLVLLGMGGDGHTASLFPGTSVLKEKERWVFEVFVPGQDFHRVTLTVPVINFAATVIFLISGSDKAHALRGVLEDSPDRGRFPAKLVNPVNGELIWLVDQEAASQLQRGLEEFQG